MSSKLELSSYYAQLTQKGVVDKYVIIGKTAYGHDRIVCVSSSVFVGSKFFEFKEDVKKGLFNSVSYIFSELEHDKVVESGDGHNINFIHPLEDVESILNKLVEADPSEAVLSDYRSGYGSKRRKEQAIQCAVIEYDKDDVLDLPDSFKTEIMSQTIDEVQGIYRDYDVAKLIVEGKANADIISLVKSTYNFKCTFMASVANALNKKHLS